jgi:hypothetical protein
MKPQKNDNNELTVSDLFTMIDLISDQLKDQRYKLRTERHDAIIPFRMSIITHYRNIKINLIRKFNTYNSISYQTINN